MGSLQWRLKTKIGPLHLVASKAGLQGVYWNEQKADFVKSLRGPLPELKVLAETARQLEDYFRGGRKTFDLPLDFQGTEFQRRVWSELARIPYGKTCSYGEIARRIRNERAVRAVGTANGRNPFAIIVPCHRVIAADGSLGGYAGGLKAKTLLLKLESDSF